MSLYSVSIFAVQQIHKVIGYNGFYNPLLHNIVVYRREKKININIIILESYGTVIHKMIVLQ